MLLCVMQRVGCPAQAPAIVIAVSSPGGGPGSRAHVVERMLGTVGQRDQVGPEVCLAAGAS